MPFDGRSRAQPSRSATNREGIRSIRTVLLPLAVLAAFALPLPASAGLAEAVSTFTWTPNMHPEGFSERAVPLDNTVPGQGRFNSDLGFWGRTAVQGHYNGFRLIDISDHENPVELVNYTNCVGDQGDVLIWDSLVIRSWNSPASATASCGGQLVGQGFEGLHIFDISNPASPVLVKQIRMAANTTPVGSGSHTATLVPDLARGNLYVYNSASSGSCPGIDIVKSRSRIPRKV